MTDFFFNDELLKLGMHELPINQPEVQALNGAKTYWEFMRLGVTTGGDSGTPGVICLLRPGMVELACDEDDPNEAAFSFDNLGMIFASAIRHVADIMYAVHKDDFELPATKEEMVKELTEAILEELKVPTPTTDLSAVYNSKTGKYTEFKNLEDFPKVIAPEPEDLGLFG